MSKKSKIEKKLEEALKRIKRLEEELDARKLVQQPQKWPWIFPQEPKKFGPIPNTSAGDDNPTGCAIIEFYRNNPGYTGALLLHCGCTRCNPVYLSYNFNQNYPMFRNNDYE